MRIIMQEIQGTDYRVAPLKTERGVGIWWVDHIETRYEDGSADGASRSRYTQQPLLGLDGVDDDLIFHY